VPALEPGLTVIADLAGCEGEDNALADTRAPTNIAIIRNCVFIIHLISNLYFRQIAREGLSPGQICVQILHVNNIRVPSAGHQAAKISCLIGYFDKKKFFGEIHKPFIKVTNKYYPYRLQIAIFCYVNEMLFYFTYKDNIKNIMRIVN